MTKELINKLDESLLYKQDYKQKDGFKHELKKLTFPSGIHLGHYNALH